jgi:hypothetical protein
MSTLICNLPAQHVWVRVSTRYYTVENTTARYGDQDAYHYLDETAECGDMIAEHMGAEHD